MERMEQIFFAKAETFFNKTVPQLCDKVKEVFQITERSGDIIIGHFVMSHLLSVHCSAEESTWFNQVCQVFVFFLDIRPIPKHWKNHNKIHNEYDPQIPLGLNFLGPYFDNTKFRPFISLLSLFSKMFWQKDVMVKLASELDLALFIFLTRVCGINAAD